MIRWETDEMRRESFHSFPICPVLQGVGRERGLRNVEIIVMTFGEPDLKVLQVLVLVLWSVYFFAFYFFPVCNVHTFISGELQLLGQYALFDRCLKYGAIMELSPSHPPSPIVIFKFQCLSSQGMRKVQNLTKDCFFSYM